MFSWQLIVILNLFRAMFLDHIPDLITYFIDKPFDETYFIQGPVQLKHANIAEHLYQSTVARRK